MSGRFFVNIFKTRKHTGEPDAKQLKPSVKNLMVFLLDYIVSEDHRPEINKKVQAFLSLSLDKQMEKLPSFYLFMEQFILNVNPGRNATKEKLRKAVSIQFPDLLEQLPVFKIIFLDSEKQVFQLYCFFLAEIARKLGDVLGTSGNHWNNLGVWLEELPEPKTSILFIADENTPSDLKEWNLLLVKVSLLLYDDVEKRFSGDFVKRFYHNSYENLSASYKNLDSFHEVLRLLPNKILDEDKVNLLSNQQIKSLLLEKVISLENLSLELMTKNQALTEARMIIEEQNEELKSYSEELETQVKKRTVELDDKNKELIRYNNQLEQYAFTISHHLRGPVARLLGLTGIFSMEDDRYIHNKLIVSKIIESTRQLDDTLKDLNRVIDIKKGVGVLGMVDVSLILGRLKKFFSAELETINAVLEVDMGSTTSFYSNSLYVESVFYNLISNAIKFRSPERQLQVKINASLSDGYICLRVSDNGLGIDLEMHKDQIFSLYQRFHVQVEGKGIGLHISKEQVEVMGGKIEVESKPDEGSVFIVMLPYMHESKNQE